MNKEVTMYCISTTC